MNVRVNEKGKFYKYTEFLKCPECGSNLYRISKNCNNHHILGKELDSIVLEYINKHIDLVCEIGTNIDDVVSVSKLEYISELKKDYKCNFISEEDYEDFKQK